MGMHVLDGNSVIDLYWLFSQPDQMVFKDGLAADIRHPSSNYFKTGYFPLEDCHLLKNNRF